ncbi:MAG: hypothetical protein ACXU9C_04145, partial [Xanthobacteraceae bacterium]
MSVAPPPCYCPDQASAQHAAMTVGAFRCGTRYQDDNSQGGCFAPKHIARAGVSRVGVRAGRMFLAGGNG